MKLWLCSQWISDSSGLRHSFRSFVSATVTLLRHEGNCFQCGNNLSSVSVLVMNKSKDVTCVCSTCCKSTENWTNQTTFLLYLLKVKHLSPQSLVTPAEPEPVNWTVGLDSVCVCVCNTKLLCFRTSSCFQQMFSEVKGHEWEGGSSFHSARMGLHRGVSTHTHTQLCFPPFRPHLYWPTFVSCRLTTTSDQILAVKLNNYSDDVFVHTHTHIQCPLLVAWNWCSCLKPFL